MKNSLHKSRIFALIGLMQSLLLFPSTARIFNIPKDYPMIDDAMVRARDGDEIIVAPGVYHESIGFTEKKIVLRSTFDGDWSVIRNTVIEGDFHTSVIGFSNITTSQSLLRGFTIRNGVGGIVGQGTHATIEYCIFQNNRNIDISIWPEQGGAINGCDGLIQNCIFEANTANLGGALANCHGTIQNNLFCNNNSHWGRQGTFSPARPRQASGMLSEGLGAALYNCNGTIRNNTFVDNYRLDFYNDLKPGALYNCKGTLVNNIIYHTTMTQPAELDGCSTPTYSLFRTAVPGRGNLAGEPLFTNPAAHDYRLQPASPAIDAGKGQGGLQADLSGIQRGLKAAARPQGDGSALDIGAYEALPRPVALWLPGGGPPEIRAGQPLTVCWQLDPQAGSTLRLRLLKSGNFVAYLGQFTGTGGTEPLLLPAAVSSGSDYVIQGYTPATPTYGSSTPRFTLTGPQPSAVAPALWRQLK